MIVEKEFGLGYAGGSLDKRTDSRRIGQKCYLAAEGSVVPALFEVNDAFEVNVLLRALFAAKFYAPADGLELPGSPILAELCERAMTAAQEAFAINSNQVPVPEVVASVRSHISRVADRGGNWAG